MGYSSSCLKIKSRVFRRFPFPFVTLLMRMFLSHVGHAALLLLFPSKAKMAGVRVCP